jgi:hypothetical protein
MKKLLMILTNARRDCCAITLDRLEKSGSLPVFDHIVFLLNGVSRTHMKFVDRFIHRHPDLPIDKILGNGIRPQGIADMQNRCIEKYPDALYMKVDEDVFVPDGWAARMVAAYEANQHHENLALITPLIPNNSFGLHALLTRFYPEWRKEFQERFGHQPDPSRAGSTWQSPAIAEWATRKWIDLQAANTDIRKRLETGDGRLEAHGSDTPEPATCNLEPATAFLPFSDPFSIGCIAYDYRHWQRMGGIPETDEPGWTTWIQENGQTNILDCSQIVLHYSFFVQQEWLDRSSLLEDVRRINLPGTLKIAQKLGFTRLGRIAKQIPAIAKRRIMRG